jgi:PhoU domain
MRTHYLSELEAVRKNLIEMGETTALLLAEALQAVVESNRGPSARASELEAQTDHQHRLIHDQCLNLITLQAPVASDARLVTGILDAIVDLELIGDYAYEIVTLCSSMDRRSPSQMCHRSRTRARKFGSACQRPSTVGGPGIGLKRYPSDRMKLRYALNAAVYMRSSRGWYRRQAKESRM